MRWTLLEDIQLLILVRQHFTSLIKQSWLDINSPVIQQLHATFNSPYRDVAALLYRLKEAKILQFASRPTGNVEQQRFKCLLQDDKALYDYSVTFPTLRAPLPPALIEEAIKCFTASDLLLSVADTVKEIAAILSLDPFQVEKILIENNLLVVNSYRQLEAYKPHACNGLELSEPIKKQTPPAEIIHQINACRERTSEFYQVHARDGAEVIFSSDGTGFGKSYGVIQSYVEYLEDFADTQILSGLFPEGGFTNLLFMSPHKSQIDLDKHQIERIIAAGGELICVVSRQDTADLDFIDWATGLTNRERYSQWCEGAKTSGYIGSEMRQLYDIIKSIDYCQAQIELQARFGTHEAISEKEMLEEQLKNHRHRLRSALELACKKLFETEDTATTSVQEYIRLGVEARHKRANGKSALKMGVYEVYLEIIKQVLPFEVCRYRPSVLLMTTNKFDTSTYRLRPCQRGEGMRLEPISFDLLIGGKLKPKDPQISTMAGKPHGEQVNYLRDEHFKLNKDCPFRQNNIRFSLVIDELHEAYTRLEESCHVTLVKQDNNLAHVFSVTGRIYNAVLSLERRKKPFETQTTFEQEKVKFITAIRELLADKCELSTGTSLDSVLAMFRDQLGAFEVNSDAADRIVSITRNVFSFNAKMYVNEEGLKRIRLRHSEDDITRIELYYEVEGDTSDTNPTLHDIFQLISAILAACAQINNPHFKRWVKNGGQESASSQNTPLGQFVDAANSVAGEVRHVFDRTTDANLLIDHFYTYLQPKTVFTMTPVAELNYVNKGAERTIILAFEMDLVKELPEAMLLRLLIGTNNKVLGLSATSGFTPTKNGNFNRHFLQRYAQDFEYQVITREPSDISLLKELRDLRAHIRSVDFIAFDAEKHRLTNTYEKSPEFKAVYDDFMHVLKGPLDYSLSNKYKKRQYRRELEALLLAAYEGKNSLILSLSGDFKRAFAKAYRLHLTAWRQHYGMSSKCDERYDKRHDQILTFTPFKGRSTIHLVFFDSSLAKTTDIKQETYIQDSNSVLVFMSTYKSAGTGLNYFVRYLKDKLKGEACNINTPCLEVDFQRLVLINSSFYSEVIGSDFHLNTLPNYVSVLKHLADDLADHKMAEFSVNFAQGDNYRLLMAEHSMSLFKVIVQAVGRIERRDTLLNTQIFLPSDVLHNVAFQFAGLSEDTSNEVVLESMSLLNYRLKEFCERLSSSHSFSCHKQRKQFEETIVNQGQRIDAVHKRILKTDWINRVRGGDFEYLALCNLFRDPDSFANPQRWLEKLQANPLYAANKQMQAIHDSLFISPQQGEQRIMLCHKRGADGLAHKDYSALSDLAGGAREYRPELSIFMQYNKYVDFSRGNLVGELFNDCDNLQKEAFADLVPHPKLVPLLKGNLGEYLFDKVLTHYKVQPLTDMEVFERLGPVVYEFFDRFIEVGDDLLCIDVKRWATKLDDKTRAEDTLEKSDKKIDQIRTIANLTADTEGQSKISEASAGCYQRIKFIYLNLAYSQNPNNLMWEENVEHSVHYLNLLQANHQYYQPFDRERQRRLEKSKLKITLQINPRLHSLLGVTALTH